MDTLKKALMNQIEDTWRIIDKAINFTDPQTWLDIENHFSYGQRLHHLLETWEFYMRDNPERMKWGHLINLPSNLTEETWESELYRSLRANLDVSKLKSYSDNIKEDCKTKINNLESEALMAPDGFSKHLSSRIAKYIYLLRHTMWHLGELSYYKRITQQEKIIWE